MMVELGCQQNEAKDAEVGFLQMEEPQKGIFDVNAKKALSESMMVEETSKDVDGTIVKNEENKFVAVKEQNKEMVNGGSDSLKNEANDFVRAEEQKKEMVNGESASIQMDEGCKEVEDVETDVDDSFIDYSNDEEPSISNDDDESNFEAPLSDAEIEELVAEFLEVESKAAEAQESLEKESLAQVESEVRAELAQNLQGDDLESAVSMEMKTFKEEWERVLDELEDESSLLLEQLDGAGIELPHLFKWLENQAPNGCHTEAWKRRAHWMGSQKTTEVSESVADAERFLQSCRPVRRKHGKLLEEGASGFLGRKLTSEDDMGLSRENLEKDWSTFNELINSHRISQDDTSFGGKHWASVYLASTPQEAADSGLKLPGVNEVEEIDDIECSTSDPFYADAIANEKEIDLSEEQKKNFRKVKEEDDAKVTRRLHLNLKRRRRRKRICEDTLQKQVPSVCRVVDVESNESMPDEHELASYEKSCGDIGGATDVDNAESSKPEQINCIESLNNHDEGKVVPDGTCIPSELSEDRGSKCSHDDDDAAEKDNKRNRTAIINGDAELPVEEKSVSCISEDDNFKCTACSKILRASEVCSHPLLEVIICENCKTGMEEKMKQKALQDPDCSECYCGWCGRSSDLLNCVSCKMLFCTTCIRRNFSEELLSDLQSSHWHCCCCLPSILQQLVDECDKALRTGGQLVSSSDSDSGPSDTEIGVPISDKKRRKRKIRRILEDAELGEETKRTIAIEKARQEHLKSFAGKSWSKFTSSCNGSAIDGASIEVLGDSTNGYIVNVAREEDEEPVKIPPSISAKLKPHQVAGIRFLWENIIQSVRKVRSGDKGLGCILAHTMGLGKTFQVIAFLYTAMRSVDLGLRTALIVTPVNVLHNWRQEFVKWRPVELKPLRVYMLEDVPRERRSELLCKWRRKGGIFLIGYSSFRNLSLGRNVKDRNMAIEMCHALQNGPDILVCDEAHMIKNTRADVTYALKQVKCQRRIALTGSPLQNNLMEYYCMVDFVREGFLGSSHEFRNRFQNPIENGQHTNSTLQDVKIMNQRSHILYEQLKGFVQRMDMSVVKKDLPPKTVFVITVKLSPLQKKLYKRFLDVHGFATGKVSGDKAMKRCFFAGYQALAQIWNHPGLLQLVKEQKISSRREDAVDYFLDDSSSDDNLEREMLNGEKLHAKNDFSQKKNGNGCFFHEESDWWNDLLHQRIYREIDYSGKMVLLLDILSMSAEVGDKALVFSQSLTTLDLIELYLSRLIRKGREGKYWKQGKDWYRLDGNTEGSERQKLVERFNDPKNRRVKCTLISTRAGSLGINLYAANHVIIVDGSWNPTHDLQAIYRAWRYGQTKPVYAYRLMAHGTMEEKIYKRQVTKEGLAARVVDRQQVHRTMSKEEILHLFDFGYDENVDILEQGAECSVLPNQDMTLKQKSLPCSKGGCSSDKFMDNLLCRHYPRWIANYHEHETLLQENEAEKLSKEEQDMAWETFRRSLEWEEVQRVSLDEAAPEPKPTSNAVAAVEDSLTQTKSSLRNRTAQRKCTKLAHLLTLRSQGTRAGSSTICGECSQVISWETLNRDGKMR